jgi:hypothetical protein
VNKFIFFATLFAVICSVQLFPQDSSAAQPEDLIGLSPKEIIKIMGSPDSIYPFRGQSQWQDDVIFYYESNIYLFFYDNHVWQIRCDQRFKEKILGIAAGMKKSKVKEILGKPFYAGENDDIYLNPAKITRLEKGFPVRLRLIYDQDDKVCDIYVYRGDY